MSLQCYEVIVVDDGSTDATAKIAGEYDLRFISTENQGLSNARTLAWRRQQDRSLPTSMTIHAPTRSQTRRDH